MHAQGVEPHCVLGIVIPAVTITDIRNCLQGIIEYSVMLQSTRLRGTRAGSVA